MKKYLQNKDLITSELDDDLVMLDLDQGKYFGLNPVAKDIWNFLESAKTSDEIVNYLCSEYEISESACKNDLESYLKDLLKYKLISDVS